MADLVLGTDAQPGRALDSRRDEPARPAPPEARPAPSRTRVARMRALAARVRAGAEAGEPLPPPPAPSAGNDTATEAQALAFLASAEMLPTASTTLCNSAAASRAAAEALNDADLVVKASARDLLHRERYVGAVLVGSGAPDEAAAAHEHVVAAAAAAGATPEGSIVQARAPEGVELIVGGATPSCAGSLVGPGGLSAELVRRSRGACCRCAAERPGKRWTSWRSPPSCGGTAALPRATSRQRPPRSRDWPRPRSRSATASRRSR